MANNDVVEVLKLKRLVMIHLEPLSNINDFIQQIKYDDCKKMIDKCKDYIKENGFPGYSEMILKVENHFGVKLGYFIPDNKMFVIQNIYTDLKNYFVSN